LERQFREDRVTGCEALAARIDAVALMMRQQLDAMSAEKLACGDAKFEALETNLFLLAPMVAACPEQLPGYLQLYTRMREAVKRQYAPLDKEIGRGWSRVRMSEMGV